MVEKFIDGRAVIVVKGRNKQKGDDDPGQKRADEKLGVLPVFHIGDGGHGDNGDGADLRGHKGQAGGPPGDFAAPQEKVGGGFLFPAASRAPPKSSPREEPPATA